MNYGFKQTKFDNELVSRLKKICESLISDKNIELLTVEEYSKRFCVSRTTVFEWKKSGILIPGRHYIKICRTLRFIWCYEVISELHESNSRNTENTDQHTNKSAKSKTGSKKGALSTWSIEFASFFRYPPNYGQPDRKEGC